MGSGSESMASSSRDEPPRPKLPTSLPEEVRLGGAGGGADDAREPLLPPLPARSAPELLKGEGRTPRVPLVRSRLMEAVRACWRRLRLPS